MPGHERVCRRPEVSANPPRQTPTSRRSWAPPPWLPFAAKTPTTACTTGALPPAVAANEHSSHSCTRSPSRSGTSSNTRSRSTTSARTTYQSVTPNEPRTACAAKPTDSASPSGSTPSPKPHDKPKPSVVTQFSCQTVPERPAPATPAQPHHHDHPEQSGPRSAVQHCPLTLSRSSMAGTTTAAFTRGSRLSVATR